MILIMKYKQLKQILIKNLLIKKKKFKEIIMINLKNKKVILNKIL